MHRTLWIREILLDIFGYCRPSKYLKASADLAVLARTCRVFQDPALDVLWEELPDPSPLLRCVPQAYCRIYEFSEHSTESCNRSFTQSEWSVLQNYARRIRSLSQDSDDGFDWESFITFLPSTTEPLFPNLRNLICNPATLAIEMHFPSLKSLCVQVDSEADLETLQDSLESFSAFSLNLRELDISVPERNFDLMSSDVLSGCISRWKNLHTVGCYHIAFDLSTLVHLSRLPALAHLSYTMHSVFMAQLASFGSSLVFPTLRHLGLFEESLHPISQLLSRTQLPVITSLHADIQCCPSKLDVSSFFNSIQTSGCSHTIQNLQLFQGNPYQRVMITEEDSKPVLGLEDLRSCMAFSNLRGIDLNVEWKIELTDNELLTLASAWRHLEFLCINALSGWRTQGGITPNGLLWLLKTCPSLNYMTLAIDTGGYTQHTDSPASLGLTLSPTLNIGILDSVIEEEAVLAVAAFFASIGSCSELSLLTGNRFFHKRSVECNARWQNVAKRVKEAVDQRS